MDALLLARLQFATTTSIHFLFVLLTLGLVTLLVYLQSAWLITRKPVYRRLTRFWGTLYVINYVLGIATGIVMEFQLGLNWSGLSHYVGNVFGAPLAMETLLAFTLESTFLGMWIFGWQRLPAVVHTALLWLVAATAYLSAFWIMVANSWLQNPVGYELRAGRAQHSGEAPGDGRAPGDGAVTGDGQVAHLTDFGAMLTNPTLILALVHVVSAALMAGGFFMAGISALHFIRRTDQWEFFRRSLRLGLVTGVVGTFFAMGSGFAQFGVIGAVQPTKYGDEQARAALVAEWTARFGPGDYLPPTWTGLPLALMISVAFTFIWGVFLLPLLYRDWIVRLRLPLYLLLLATPWPFIAAICGWLVREVGRQPWAAYGLLPVRDAVSPAGGGVLLASFVGFTALLTGLAVANWSLLLRHALRGPYDLALGREPDEEPTGHDPRRPLPARA